MLGERFAEALRYAALLHAGQSRKACTIPYVAHLLAVCALVLEDGGGEDEAIAALLHDGPEDQGGAETLAEIGRRFGPEVARIVGACTDTMESPKPAWRARKQRFLTRLSNAPADVRRVVAADKLHNALSTLADRREVGDAVFSRFSGGRDGTLWYYDGVCRALEAAGGTGLLPRLRQVLAALSG